MTTITSIVRALVQGGATPELILAAVEAAEAANLDALAQRRARDAARQQALRDRKNNVSHVTSRDVTATVNGHDLARVRDISPTQSLLDISKVSDETLAQPAKKPKAKKPGSRRVPADYQPANSIIEMAEAEGFTPGEIERELAKFRDHQFRDAHTDWDAAFRNWLRRAAERRPSNVHPLRPANVRPDHPRRPTPREDRLGRMFTGIVAATDGA